MDEELSNPSCPGGSVLSGREDIEQSIIEQFEKQVHIVPDKIAVESGGRTLSYAALNRSANRIARAIGECLGNDTDPVALLFEHDASAIPAILGVLKAGLPYVPLDPRFPMARTQSMLVESQAKLILTSASGWSAAKPWAESGHIVLNVDALGEDISDSNPKLNIEPQAPAYVLFSSGSTGKPKAIVHSHRSVMHHVWDNTTTYGLRNDDRHGLVLSYCYAASVSEIFGPLLNGATLSLFNTRDSDFDRLIRWLLRQEISVLKMPISLFRLVLRELAGHDTLTQLRLVVLGGDTLYSRDIEPFWQHVSASCRLVNRLASTETNTIAHLVMDRNTPLESRIVPVGAAAAGKEISIVDENGVTLGIGEEGEIAVKSDYLAMSYWGRDDLTEASFRPSGDDEKGRLYMTGDLGRVRSNGYLEHLGRKDSQIKIRGYRVNMAEVKAALLSLGGIANAEVAVREDEPGHKVLVAYLVPQPGHTPQVDKVRREISTSLPDYAMPAAFAVLDELPLTPTGKVDTLRLPDPLTHRPGLQRDWRAPENEEEQTLVDLWEEILVVRPIGTDDDFFDLGGDSLGAIQLMTRINHLYGKQLQVAVLLEAPTIRKMAAILRGEAAVRNDSGLVPLQPHGGETAFFCVPPAGKTALVLADLAGHFAPDRPFYGLQHLGMNTDEEPHDRIEEMAAYYLQSVREAQPEGPYYLGGLCFGGIVALEMALQLRSAGESVACLAILDSLQPPRLRISAMRPRIILGKIRALRGRKLLARALGERLRPIATFLGRRGFRLAHNTNSRGSAHRAKGNGHVQAKNAWIRRYSARGDYRPELYDDQITEQISLVWMAHQNARVRYRASRYDGQISVFYSSHKRMYVGEMNNWAYLSTMPLLRQPVPGSHDVNDSFYRGENARSLAHALADLLDNS